MQAEASYLNVLDGAPAPELAAQDAPIVAPAPPALLLPRQTPSSWAKTLLGEDGVMSAQADITRMGTGLLLSALYGTAAGTRMGGLALLQHAAAVPLAPLAITALGVPALFILLTLFDAPIDPRAMLAAASRGAATTGLILGGLAPAMALFVLTTRSILGAALCVGLGLIAGGALGLRAFLLSLGQRFHGATEGMRVLSGFALAGFAIFATALAARVWWSTLPIFGGAL